jgi:hypothetical protein
MSCNCNDKAKRAGHYCKAGTRSQFQAVIVPDSDLFYDSPTDLTQLVQLINRDARGACPDGRACSWWWITVHPKAIIRTGNVNGAPPPTFVPENFAPLEEKEILNDGASCSSLKVKLTLGDQTWKQRELIVDVGPGFAIPWYGSSVKIEVIVQDQIPRPIHPIVHIPNNTSPGVDVDAQVVEDVVIEANAVAVECCPTTEPQALLYTQVIGNQARGADLVFPKPPGARKVSVYLDNGSADQIHWTVIPGPLQNAFGFVGQVFPSPLQVNTMVGVPFAVSGPACGLVMTSVNAGVFTACWEIVL